MLTYTLRKGIKINRSGSQDQGERVPFLFPQKHQTPAGIEAGT